MRALLVVNHQATTTSQRSRDVLIRALDSSLDLTVAYTRRRRHATELARQAVGEVELVVAHGGDGTVNEVVNGLMTAVPGAGPADLPALAVVPGGSTNVFARALGLPTDWAEATGVILEALRERRTRRIGLGRAEDRYFTFCAGVGVDAAVVRRVEQARWRGRTSSPQLYAQALVSEYLFGVGRDRPDITLGIETPQSSASESERIDHLATVIIQNTAPWTYLGNRPINPNPDASFEAGLSIFAVRSLALPTVIKTLHQLLLTGDAPRGRHVLRWHDLTALTLRSGAAQSFQVDGDYLGERYRVRLTSVPDALRVLC